ncbi:MAG: family 16 glycosylhydrolase [Acidobacteriia bacterium]|nr:family 16 glycosylhydrolase [Terriglobia bacterium]
MIELNARLQLTSLQPGLVYGLYFYGCAPAACATQHDEIGIELLTNLLQPGGSPLMVHLNRCANEPLDAGNGVLAVLPAGFNPLSAHDWTIRWPFTRIDYLVDGVLLSSATTHVPEGPMQVNEIAWGPASDWTIAYSASLQPVNNAAQNQSFIALLKSMTVNEIATSSRSLENR